VTTGVENDTNPTGAGTGVELYLCRKKLKKCRKKS